MSDAKLILPQIRIVQQLEFDSEGGALPSALKEAYYYTAGNLTSIRRTDGTITVVGDAPSIAGETVGYVQTFQYYADNSLLSATGWVKQ